MIHRFATSNNNSGEISTHNGKSLGNPTKANILLGLHKKTQAVEGSQWRKDLESFRGPILAKAAFVFAREYGKWDADVTIDRICSLAEVSRIQLYELFPTMTYLYQETLKSLFERGKTAYPLDGGLTPDASARDRLLAFVRAVLYRQLGYHGVGYTESERLLLAREVAKPSPNFIRVLLDSVVPSIQYLLLIVTDLLGPNPSHSTIRYCALSVLNLCIHYGRDQALTKKLRLGLNVAYEEIEELAEHITDFSLGGMSRVLENQGRWQPIETGEPEDSTSIRKQPAAFDSKLSEEEAEACPDPKVAPVTVFCHAPNAEEVFLVGDFNNRDPQATRMTKNSMGEWFARLDLRSGDYTYHVVIDGRRDVNAAYHVLG